MWVPAAIAAPLILLAVVLGARARARRREQERQLSGGRKSLVLNLLNR
ncbi:MAG: hypothetical protein QM704_22245 [Anaeromyxobacteraceae bacterium]